MFYSLCVNAYDGRTALHIAVGSSNKEVVKGLIENGVVMKNEDNVSVDIIILVIILIFLFMLFA